MKYTDIQLTDKELWAQFQSLYKSGDYASALAILQNTQLNNKALTADILNALTDYIVQVEQFNDPDYANDRIRIERQIPTDLTSGEVYFDWTNPPSYTFSQVDSLGYKFSDVDNLGLNWFYANRGGW